jgi:hypothetical protein
MMVHVCIFESLPWGLALVLVGSSGRVEKGIWYLTLDYDDRIMIILRQILRLHGVSLLRRFVFLLASASSKSP